MKTPMQSNNPVQTSHASHIGNCKVIKELGVIQTSVEPPIIGGAFDSHVEALDNLKEVARKIGANGIINVEQESSQFNGKPVRLRGIAVLIEPLSK